MKIRIITLGMVHTCPIMAWDATHYRDDGTCLCPPGEVADDGGDQAEV